MVASLDSQRAAGTLASDAAPGGDSAAARALWLASGGVLLVWAAHNGLLLPWELENIDPRVREPVFVLVRALVWMTPVWLYLRWHDPRPRLIALGVTSPIDRRGLWWSILGGSIYLSLVVLLASVTAPPRNAPSVLATLGRVETLYMLTAVALEELFMRGFLLRQLLRFTTSFRAQASVAVLFALMHLPGWLATQGARIEHVPGLILLTILGAVLGGITLASNGILLAVVVHFANNMVAELLGGS
jgi:membrane protease YdiL (CAAX protease family)